ncbi:MAG: hypothetical protein KJ721_00450 [Nanoarchaeota archaeon]|nr:hypothetical protein [Nanoarchaeota archaeon]
MALNISSVKIVAMTKPMSRYSDKVRRPIDMEYMFEPTSPPSTLPQWLLKSKIEVRRMRKELEENSRYS